MTPRPSSDDYYSPHPRVALERPLAVTGLPGSDVARSGWSLAAATGLHFIELERLTEGMVGATRAAVVVREGVEALREADDRALRRALRDRPAGVIAIEAAMPRDGTGLAALYEACFVVYVRRPVEELLARIRRGRERAPARFPEFLVAAPGAVSDLEPLIAAQEHAHDAAHAVFDAGSLHPDRVGDELRASLPFLA